jgi:putative hemolysin
MQGRTAKDNILNIQEHLQSEAVVIVFPAGEVSRLRP